MEGIAEHLVPVLLAKKLEGSSPEEDGVANPVAETVPHNLPLTQVVEFVGRETELAQLHRRLQAQGQVAVVAGMGGVGKTELARDFARRRLGEYPGGVVWLFGRQDAGIQIVQFARTWFEFQPLEEEDIVQQVARCWAQWCEGTVLLVVDDVEDYEQLKPFLPSAQRFRVLLTTREKLLEKGQRLELGVLPRPKALALLKLLVGTERVRREPWQARRLCQELGYLPLGLELVGRYLADKEDLSLAQMLERLANKGLGQRALSRRTQGMTAQLGVAAAFELSWEQLSLGAQSLAGVLGLFGQAPMLWELVGRVIEGVAWEEALAEADEEEWEEARDLELLHLHLLERVAQGTSSLASVDSAVFAGEVGTVAPSRGE